MKKLIVALALLSFMGCRMVETTAPKFDKGGAKVSTVVVIKEEPRKPVTKPPTVPTPVVIIKEEPGPISKNSGYRFN